MLDKQKDFLDRHEKFIAFILLGAALFALAVMAYIRPPNGIRDNGAALAIMNTIVGALTLAFGGAANALFKISDSDRKQIGQAAADAVAAGPPVETKVVNTPEQPVQTEEASSRTPPMFREDDNG